MVCCPGQCYFYGQVHERDGMLFSPVCRIDWLWSRLYVGNQYINCQHSSLNCSYDSFVSYFCCMCQDFTGLHVRGVILAIKYDLTTSCTWYTWSGRGYVNVLKEHVSSQHRRQIYWLILWSSTLTTNHSIVRIWNMQPMYMLSRLSSMVAAAAAWCMSGMDGMQIHCSAAAQKCGVSSTVAAAAAAAAADHHQAMAVISVDAWRRVHTRCPLSTDIISASDTHGGSVAEWI